MSYLYVTSSLRLPQQLHVLVGNLNLLACLTVDGHAVRKPEPVFYAPYILPRAVIVNIASHGQNGSFSFLSSNGACGSPAS